MRSLLVSCFVIFVFGVGLAAVCLLCCWFDLVFVWFWVLAVVCWWFTDVALLIVLL